MHFPTWVDLKGEDAVPDTVHHVVALVNPKSDKRWINLKSHILVIIIPIKLRHSFHTSVLFF